MTTNCIKFTSDDIETAKGVGSISTLTFDLDITVEPVASSNPMAPTHRVLGRSPRGKLVECGGIWKKQNKDTGSDYFTLTVRDHARARMTCPCKPLSPGARKRPLNKQARPLRRSACRLCTKKRISARWDCKFRSREAVFGWSSLC